jgi:hypothetical protein
MNLNKERELYISSERNNLYFAPLTDEITIKR